MEDLIISFRFFYKFILANYLEIALALTAIGLTYKIYQFWTFNRNEWDLDDTIFNPQIFDIQANYEPGQILPPYPNLWYPIIQSGELKPGQVKPLFVIGQNLVAFRASSGTVHVLDAFCPHFGAHLGVGGSVVGEDIRCPFHSWTFNGDGDCSSVPGLSTANIPKAKVKSWKCTEMNNWVYIWFDGNDEEPKYRPKAIPELKNRTNWAQHSSYFNGHLVDFLANPFDVTHFNALHSVSGPFSVVTHLRRQLLYNLTSKMLHIDYTNVETELDCDPDSPCGEVNMVMTPVVFGFRLTCFQMVNKTKFYAPAFLFSLTMVHFKAMTAHALITYVPVGPMRSRCVFNVYHGADFQSKLMSRLYNYLIQPKLLMEQAIFNNKRFKINPCWTSLDKPMMMFYRWFKDNFYSLAN